MIKVSKVTVLANTTVLLVDEDKNVVVHFITSAVGLGGKPDLSNPADRISVIGEGKNLIVPKNDKLYCYYEGPIGSSIVVAMLIIKDLA